MALVELHSQRTALVHHTTRITVLEKAVITTLLRGITLKRLEYTLHYYLSTTSTTATTSVIACARESRAQQRLYVRSMLLGYTRSLYCCRRALRICTQPARPALSRWQKFLKVSFTIILQDKSGSELTFENITCRTSAHRQHRLTQHL